MPQRRRANLNYMPRTFDLAKTPLRELNRALHQITDGAAETAWEILNPEGSHAVAAGVDQPITIDVQRQRRLLLRRHEQ